MNVLMIHGVDTNEDANPNPYAAWGTAINTGLQGAGYSSPISTDPDTNGLKYNDIFDNHSANPAVYAAAVAELVASWSWHSIFGLFRGAPLPQQPGDGLLQTVRWTAGMVAQWTAEKGLQSDCRDRIADAINHVQPDIIFAHSLGTLLCYDLFVNDKRGATIFKNGILVTFGSQIANSFIADKMWGGKLKRINVKAWYNLYNPYDHVFVASIDLTAPNFHQFTIQPPFGNGGLFDTQAHQAVAGGGTGANNYPGYLDNTTTNAHLWPALIPNLTMASLITAKIGVMKHLKKMPAVITPSQPRTGLVKSRSMRRSRRHSAALKTTR